MAVAIAVGTWLSIACLDGADEVGAWFAFKLTGSSGRLSDATAIALDNLRLAAVPYAGGWALRHVPKLRWLVDLVLAFLLTANAALVGAAFAAYGPALASILIPHLPLELAAFSVAGGSYITMREGRVSRRVTCSRGAVTVALLVAAAVAETELWLG